MHQNLVNRMKKSSKKSISKRLLICILVSIIFINIITTIYFVYLDKPNSQNSLIQNISQKDNLKVIVVLASKSIDLVTGAPKDIQTQFSSKDKFVYVNIELSNNSLDGAKVEYIRFINDKFIDNGQRKLKKDDKTYISFLFETTNADRVIGDYKIKIYLNGNYIKDLLFNVV